MPPTTSPLRRARVVLAGFVMLALTISMLVGVSRSATASSATPGASAPASGVESAPIAARKGKKSKGKKAKGKKGSCTKGSKAKKNQKNKKKCGKKSKGKKSKGNKGRKDPRFTRGLFVDDLMPAYQAGGVYQQEIGKKAQALWITDYYRSPSSVKSAVAAYTSRAAAQNKTPMMSIYAIPGRDCGLYSSGGLSSYPEYRQWAKAAAAGMRGTKAIVVVEPDAVPFMDDPRCVDSAPRQAAIAFAVKKFAKAGAWVYIDGGHSGWRDPAVMAGLLKRSGMKWARGFSTNVGNHRLTSAEHSYGESLVRELTKVGLTGKKYVTETARNGANPAPVNGDVCNPTSARVGAPPQLQFRGSFDGYLWIKHPGESDGECNGGPSSGAWWPAGADVLLGR